ncbi:MAG: hypothetical protein SWO11_16275 [Thermodesulfobacteriota bacterium]|nr:hypothetical protein [Thermodesulfobacteriota bacterium]
MRSCQESIDKIFELVNTMFEVSNEGYADREEPGFDLIYSVVRDSAYKIKKLVEAQQSPIYNNNRCLCCKMKKIEKGADLLGREQENF